MAVIRVRELHMSKAKIAIVGAGLMGHGIAQVFALAGHEVTVSDTIMKNLDTLESRIAANLRDLGEDDSAVARCGLASISVKRFATSITWSRRCTKT
jgi:3-hydroxyacyl-CoA dehydrogenase